MTYLLFALWLQGPGASQAPTFFTVQTLFTSAGITTAVVTITAVLHGLIPNFPAKWFALGLSLALALGDISVHDRGWSALSIFVAVLNGLLVYAAAVGVNTVSTAPTQVAAPQAKSIGGRSFRWWK